MPLIRRVRAAFRNAFASPGARLFGWRFSRDYLRFAFRAARRWGASSGTTLKLLGLTIACPNQTYALFLVHEIFVNAAYAFRRRPHPRIVDCGANIGLSVAFFKAYAPDASIVAVEADSDTFAQLAETVEHNNLRDVTLVHAAVSASDGVVPLYIAPGDRGSIIATVVPERARGVAREVPSRRLSSIVNAPIDFLKLDIEGAEYDVVDDLAGAGRLALVQEAVIECHEIRARPDAQARLVAQLERAGMRVTVDRADAATGIALIRADRGEAGELPTRRGNAASSTRAAIDWLRMRAPTPSWRIRNAVALAVLYAGRVRRRISPDADAYDEEFWRFHSLGDWDGFARIVRQFVPARSLVDIGCGHGLALGAFVRADPTMRARGFDDSDAALRLAAAHGLAVERLDMLSLSGRRADALARELAETDLALCLEVAEHLPPWHAGTLLTLCSAPRHLVFSAAQPNQGGRLHVNEQPPAYWIDRLARRGQRLDPRDAEFREAVGALNLPWWYARNVHLFTRTDR